MSQLSFFLSIAYSIIAWSVVASRFIWPRLRFLRRSDALRPLLIVHAFRFVGLAFLVPGVVSPDLPAGFAHPAAYGDIIAATLALLTLATPEGLSIVVAWVFNLWGFAELVADFYQANRTGLLPQQLGAAFFIPTVVVPLLLITHVLMFRILVQRRSDRVHRDVRAMTAPPTGRGLNG